MVPTSLFPGFALGLSLIVAIGAQNAFVLRQGLRREHVFWVCLTCALSDSILIVAGVSGFGVLSETHAWFGTAMLYGGAGFLVIYGAKSFYSAWRGNEGLAAADVKQAPLASILATILALTWLNPHVYLDTVVLLGSISSQYPDPALFGLGATMASFTFFFSLGYGARALAPVFSRPRAWQILDVVIGVTMWAIAWKLIHM